MAALAAKHAHDFEEVFNRQRVRYSGEGAPSGKTVVKDLYGADKDGLLYRDKEVGLSDRYKGYLVRAKVITISDAKQDRFDSPYATTRITERRGIQENKGFLSVHSASPIVFHEYLHHFNTYNEYPLSDSRRKILKSAAKAIGDVEGIGFRDFVDHHGYEPDIKRDEMACGGTRVCQRYLASALWDIANVGGEKIPQTWLLDDTHYLDPADPVFQQDYDEGLAYKEVMGIIAGSAK